VEWEGIEVTKRTRGNGEGSIYQRSRDGKWVTAMTLPDGRRKTWISSTWKDARKKLQEGQQALKEQRPVAPERMTLARYLDDWLENSVRPSVRPKTYAGYKQLCRLYIVPTLGKVQLQELSASQVQSLQNSLRRKGLSVSTVMDTRAVLKRALNQAVKWDLVLRNVVTLVDPPKREHVERQILTRHQVFQLVAALDGDRLKNLFVTALALGLRKGELLGLQWQDVDLESGKLTIRAALQRLDGELKLMEPKTRTSKRVVTLPQIVTRTLRAQRQQQREERLLAGRRWVQTNFVFTSSVGTPMEPANVNHALTDALKRAGLPHIRFHDLRHQTASILLGQNIRVKDVSTLLGHSGPAVTQSVYEHYLEDPGQVVADEMDRFFGQG
jgi:integrase